MIGVFFFGGLGGLVWDFMWGERFGVHSFGVIWIRISDLSLSFG